MKIVHCLNHFLPNHIAGTEVYTYTLIKELSKLGVESIVIIPNYGNSFDDCYYYEEIKVIKYAEPSIVDRSMIMGRKIPLGVDFFLEVLKRESPDIVHFQEVAGNNGFTIHHIVAAELIKMKIVLTCHLPGYTCKTGTLMYEEKELCDGKIDVLKCSRCAIHFNGIHGSKLKLIEKANSIIYSLGYDITKYENKISTAFGYPFIIKKLKDDLFKLINSTTKIIVLTKFYFDMLLSNGVSEEQIEYLPQSVPFYLKLNFKLNNFTKFRLIFIGRISELKGLHILLSAMRNLDENKIELDIYGKNDDDEYYFKCRELSKNANNISWMGQIMQSEVIETMSNYNALCLPSTFSEMSPLVIQEAFNARIPVVASNVYGNREQIRHGINGWLFQMNDINDLTNLLQNLINNPDLVSQAIKGIPEVTKFDTVAKRMQEIYINVIQE